MWHHRKVKWLSLSLAAVAIGVAVGVLLFSSEGHPSGPSRPAESSALIRGTASPCSGISTGVYSYPVTVSVFHGATLVDRTEINAARRPMMAQAYRFRVRVSPGRYRVSTSWNVHASISVANGDVSSLNLNANYCK